MLHRPRILRQSSAIRSLVAETILTPSDFIAPLFIVEGKLLREEISSMPGYFRVSLDVLKSEVKDLWNLGIKSVLLFIKCDDELKDNKGTEAINDKGLMQKAIQTVKESQPEMVVMTDVALDPYSTFGHDGIVDGNEIVNDATVRVLAEMSVSHARAGADFVAPSDMMDGRILAIREALEKNGFTKTGIMSYSAKYASCFYGPFRDALDSAPGFGDKKTYQMDFANRKEAVKETMLDIDEGADIVMVKPALSYLDIIREIKNSVNVPVSAYQVSGEYAMIKAASKMGWLSEEKAIIETLTAIKRAGADLIATYFAERRGEVAGVKRFREINKPIQINTTNMNQSTSETLFKRAQQSIPGGVNSPVRAFKSVGGTPVFINRAEGAYLYDEDGNRYIDYINSWGPMILGHAYRPLVEAIQQKVKGSTSFGAPTELEIEVAELIKTMAPNIDLIRMVSSGTEACMSAIRLARGYTGRNKFIKFEGCYHGHADAFLVKAGSGVATLGIQAVPGVTEGVALDTLTAPYNNLEAVKKLISLHSKEIAAIIIEPVAGNMGCILPEPGFLDGLRAICIKENIVLIFDEVMTGFRLAEGGAQQKLKVDADLITFGKVIGGGMPVGAFGGKKEIMSQIAPLGKVYQAGTLSGNPIAMIAGYTLLKTLHDDPDIYTSLEQKGAYLEEGLHQVLKASGKDYVINRLGSMISVHFSKKVTNFEEASSADNQFFNIFFHEMLKRGIYLPPSAFESWFLSNALTIEDLDNTIKAAKESLKV